jgi:large subunit ribosomal protein L10
MRPEKQQLVADIQALIEASNCLFLVTYKGLSAEDFGSLRSELEKVEAECHVVPNRLFLRAAEAAGQTELAGVELVGDAAMVGTGADPVATAKVLRDFGKDHPELGMRLGVLANKLYSAEEAIGMADLPSKEVLQAQLLGLLQAPASQLASVLNAKVASIVYVLNAYLRSKEEAA